MIDILTFGCRLNFAQSEIMRARAAAAGLDDALLVNTCAVTGEAVRQARQAIRRAKRERPQRRVIVSGCAAQIDPGSFAAMPKVDRVLGNREKLLADSYRATTDAEARVQVGDIMAATTAGHLALGSDGRTRALVEAQNGCDHRCTFCVIPFGWGPSRSVPVAALIDHARRLVAGGYAELVLTGVDLTAYGADLPDRPTLGGLVRAILAAVPELRRLRLSSIDAVEMDDELLRALADEDRLMPHLHLSLQSGDDLILKRMKRRHSRADAVALADRARRLRPDVVFGADLIAGFPTESEEAFAGSLGIVEDCGLAYLHVFPFSPRPGTPAARMPQLDRTLIKERAARLRARGAAAFLAHLEGEVGRQRRILVEAGGVGRTEQFTLARIAGRRQGEIVESRIAGHDAAALVAVPYAAAA